MSLLSMSEKAKSARFAFRILAMFYIGSNVMDWPLEGQRAIADGLSFLLLDPSLTDVGVLFPGHEICVRESRACYMH